MKLEKTLKTLSSGQKNPKKPKKPQKNPKKTQKNPLGWVFLKKPGFFPTLKNSKKNCDSYYFVTRFVFLSLKNDVNVPSKSNKQKKLC
jgi:hypothetical protein